MAISKEALQKYLRAAFPNQDYVNLSQLTQEDIILKEKQPLLALEAANSASRPRASGETIATSPTVSPIASVTSASTSSTGNICPNLPPPCVNSENSSTGASSETVTPEQAETFHFLPSKQQKKARRFIRSKQRSQTVPPKQQKKLKAMETLLARQQEEVECLKTLFVGQQERIGSLEVQLEKNQKDAAAAINASKALEDFTASINLLAKRSFWVQVYNSAEFAIIWMVTPSWFFSCTLYPSLLIVGDVDIESEGIQVSIINTLINTAALWGAGLILQWTMKKGFNHYLDKAFDAWKIALKDYLSSKFQSLEGATKLLEEVTQISDNLAEMVKKDHVEACKNNWLFTSSIPNLDQPGFYITDEASRDKNIVGETKRHELLGKTAYATLFFLSIGSAFLGLYYFQLAHEQKARFSRPDWLPDRNPDGSWDWPDRDNPLFPRPVDGWPDRPDFASPDDWANFEEPYLPHLPPDAAAEITPEIRESIMMQIYERLSQSESIATDSAAAETGNTSLDLKIISVLFVAFTLFAVYRAVASRSCVNFSNQSATQNEREDSAPLLAANM